MRHDLLSDALSHIQNNENAGKRECSVSKSNLVRSVLDVLEQEGYIGKITTTDREITVQLIGKINSIHIVRPRFAVEKDEFAKYEERYLPSREIGIIVVSTSQGVMSHKEAKEKKIGGRLLAYVY